MTGMPPLVISTKTFFFFRFLVLSSWSSVAVDFCSFIFLSSSANQDLIFFLASLVLTIFCQSRYMPNERRYHSRRAHAYREFLFEFRLFFLFHKRSWCVGIDNHLV